MTIENIPHGNQDAKGYCQSVNPLSFFIAEINFCTIWFPRLTDIVSDMAIHSKSLHLHPMYETLFKSAG